MRGAPTKAPATVGGRYITLGTKADPSTAQPFVALGKPALAHRSSG
jgi:hypothetical protein